MTDVVNDLNIDDKHWLYNIHKPLSVSSLNKFTEFKYEENTGKHNQP